MTDEKEARGPVTHILKTDPAPFADLLVGRKNSEVRQADRDYQVGDRLALRETTLSAQKRGILRVEAQYTGRELSRTITHIQRGYGLPDGIAVLSLSQLPPSAPPAAPIDEPRLDAPAQVGNARFGKGVPHRFVIEAAQRHHAYMNTPEREAERIAHANVLMSRLRAEIGLADKLPSMSAHHVEQLLRDTVPGGSVCDPQQVADSIRAWFGQRAAPAPSASPAAPQPSAKALTDEPAIWELASKFFSAESSYEAIMGFARALLAAVQPSEDKRDAWVAVSDHMPDAGRTVLAFYLNSLSKPRRIRAVYVGEKTREHNPDCDEGDAIYDEATDTFYWVAGWYEQIDNWDDYSCIAVTEGEVTYWSEMPSGPAIDAALHANTGETA